MTELILRNRQRRKPLNLRLIRQLTRQILDRLDIHECQLGVYFVSPKEMARLNETFLNHTGSTDVISFPYNEPGSSLLGEIFISVEDAVRQAQEFQTTWQAELIRYLVHGILHLKGFDDQNPAARRVMKQHENRLLKQVSCEVSIQHLEKKRT